MDKVRAIPILDVAKELGIEAKKHGSKWLAQCLWHSDSNPSMIVGGMYNMVHCMACGESHDAVGLVMRHEGVGFVDALKWLENRYGIARRAPKAPKAPSNSPRGEDGHADDADRKVVTFNPEWVRARMNMNNSFVMCLKDVFGEDAAARVVRDYWLCSVGARFGVNDVGFPLIDKKGVVRDVKVQGYQWDKRSNRYFHGNGTCYWLGPTALKALKALKAPSNSPKGEEGHADDEKDKKVFDRRCLFGEHLLGLHPDKTVVLVESPKNACVGSARFPELLWVATGNKTMLNREVLEVLSGRRVVVFPDNDAYKEWSDKLEGFSDIARFKVLPIPADVGEKGDIADWIICKNLIDY